MLVKISVLTPKNKAAEAVEYQKGFFFGMASKKIIEQKVTAHNKFYWVVEANESQTQSLILKTAWADMVTKKFYRELFKAIDRANWLTVKFKKGGAWAMNWVIKRLAVKYKLGDIKDNLKNVAQEENGLIVVTDREEMEKFLQNKTLFEVSYNE